MLDDQDVRFLDETWMRGHIAGVSQGFAGVVVLYGKTLWENVAVGVCGRPGYGTPGPNAAVSDQDVEEACRMAMVHEFVKDLPEGYQTVLGSSSAGQGVALSGGQRQRLALARARVRDPTVLILGTLNLPILKIIYTHNYLCRRGNISAGRNFSYSCLRSYQTLAQK